MDSDVLRSRPTGPQGREVRATDEYSRWTPIDGTGSERGGLVFGNQCCDL